MKSNIRKTIAVLGILTVGATSLTGCGETTATAQDAPQTQQAQQAQQGQGEQKGEASGERGAGQTGEAGEGMQARGTMLVGRVTKILGNEVTIDLAETGGMGDMMQNRGEGEMTGGGGMAAGGEASEEMMAQRQEAMASGGGADMKASRGEGATGAGGGEMSAGRGETGGNAGGGMAAGGNAGGSTTSTVGDSITLTGVEETYSIPVGTAVMQYGMEMSFTQITEKMYISLMVDEENNVLSVNVLG